MSTRSKYAQQLFALETCLLITLWVLNPVFGKTEESVLSPKEIEAIIPQIKAAEKGIHNIKVDAESWVEERVSASEPWQRTPTYVSCTAWIHGRPKGKVRVDVQKEVLKWMEGAAPYAGSSYTISFDGTNTKFMRKTAGPSDKQFASKEGEVSPGRPKG